MTHSRVLTSLADAARTVLVGVAMGGADVVPGVSGGTIALIAGVYHRLVTAISRFDGDFLRLIASRRWRAGWQHVELGFLLRLALGLGVGFLLMMVLMTRLLGTETTRPLTFAAFSGLILASAILLARSVRNRTPAEWGVRVGLGVAGAALAAALAMLPGQAVEPSLGYVFFCGMVAIVAMILPGISGAMILVLLGTYEYLAGTPGRIVHGENIGYNVAVMGTFAVAAAIGLGAFSRVLKWLLAHRPDATIAILTGFMFGSVVKLWPFQRDTTPEIAEFRKKIFEPVMPVAWDGSVTAAVGVFALAMAAVFLLDWARQRWETRRGLAPPDLSESPPHTV